MFFRRQIERCQDAPVDGDQVRCELDRDFFTGGQRELFFDLGKVPVFGHAVGPDTFVAFAEKIIDLGFPAGAADATEGIGDDAGRLDQSGFEQRKDRQDDAGRIAAGRRDEQGFFDMVPVKFGQAINGFFQEIRRGMIVGVKLLVDFGAFEPEIGAEVDDDANSVDERHGVFGGDAMGLGEEDGVGLFGQDFGVGLSEPERPGFGMAGELWEHLRQRLAGILARGHGDQFRVRMIQQQLHQDLAGITRRADDRHFFRFHFLKNNR